VLGGEGPDDLRTKSLRTAETLLDVCGVEADPTRILDSGRALDKFRDIVAAQDGDPDVTVDDLEAGQQTRVVESERAGVVQHLDNRLVNGIARRAGSPTDTGAGLVLHCRVGEAVERGDPLFTVYAEKDEKLREAAAYAADVDAARVGQPNDPVVERF
jgi:AMP phosphorylase